MNPFASCRPGRRHLPGNLHRLARHQHRQPRPADAAVRPGYRPGRPAVGGRRLCAVPERLHAVFRTAERPLRSQAHLAARGRPVQLRFAALRAGHLAAAAAVRTRGPGHRRGAVDTRRAVDPYPGFPRSRPARPGDRRLDLLQRAVADPRPAARRPAGGARRLAEHLPDQPAARPAGARPGPVGHRGNRAPRARRLRSPGAVAQRGLAGSVDLRPDRRGRGRLVVSPRPGRRCSWPGSACLASSSSSGGPPDRCCPWGCSARPGSPSATWPRSSSVFRLRQPVLPLPVLPAGAGCLGAAGRLLPGAAVPRHGRTVHAVRPVAAASYRCDACWCWATW